MQHFLVRAALAAAISSSFVADADAGAQAAAALDPVVVTANRLTVPAPQALASVTVLDRDQIAASQAPDLLSLLARQAGIDVARTGGPGQSSTVFLRGSNSNHTLVLIDGIRVNAATQGIIDLAHLPLSQVERIEIVRGPRAALWGSDAIGGVIHVFTRDPSEAFVEARVGSHQLASASAGAGAHTADGRGRIGIAAGRDTVRGFSATAPGAFGHDPDSDGHRNSHLGLRARSALGSQRLAFTGLLTDADVEFDQGRTAALNRVFGLTLAGDLGRAWSHDLVLGHSSEDLDTPAFDSRFGSARDSLDWIHRLALGRHALVLGANWSREEGYSLEGGGGFEASRRNAALFASFRGEFGTQQLEASLRRDDNSQFDGATTGNLAWGWQAGPDLRLRASWGQGFRSPNFNELYYPGFFGLFAGNPALEPERSDSVEAGLEWRPSVGQQLGASVFRTRISELIAFEGPMLQAINIHRARIEGIELDYRFARGAFSLQANASWLDARDAGTGAALLRRPRRKAHVGLDYGFDSGAKLGIDASAFAARPDFGGNRLAGYARLDLRVAVPVASGWTVEARVENALDRDYALVDGFNTPGLGGSLGLRWNAD